MDVRHGMAAVLATLALAGCAGVGVERVEIDRSDYGERLRHSEKAQLLANVVALRYGDAPVFLSVASVISQYTREASGHLTVGISPAPDEHLGQADAGVVFRETPTITYAPLSGERFARSMLSPIPPASLLAMVEAGWAADDLFNVTVRSINGVRNTARAPLFAQASDPQFGKVIAAFRRLQQSGALSIRVGEKDRGFMAVAHLRETLSDAERADVVFLRGALGVTGDGQARQLVFATEAAHPGELALTTRSMFEVLQELGQGVDLKGDDSFPPDVLVRIHSGPRPPADAHIAIRGRGRWFWIAGDDTASQRAFLLVQIMMSLNDDAGAAKAPLVTIPAG